VVVDVAVGAVVVVVQAGVVVVVVPATEVLVRPPGTVLVVELVATVVVVVPESTVVVVGHPGTVVVVGAVVVVVGDGVVPARVRWNVCEAVPPLPVSTSLKPTTTGPAWSDFQIFMYWVSEVVQALGLWLQVGVGVTEPLTIWSWQCWARLNVAWTSTRAPVAGMSWGTCLKDENAGLAVAAAPVVANVPTAKPVAATALQKIFP
jgi:hypothetical protein